MSYLSYIIANVVNIISIVGNAVITGYAVHVIQNNTGILSNLHISTSCKEVYTYNMVYSGLSGLYVLVMGSKLLCNICNTRTNVHWKGSFIILMSGVSVWGYKLYNKVNTPNYCDGIYNNDYLELYNLLKYQLLSFISIHGLFVVGKMLICMTRRGDSKVKKTDSLKLKTSTSGTKFTM